MVHDRSSVEQRTRVLIVDDSAVVRSLLRSVVLSDPALDVAGTAADGASALNLLGSIRPDLILLDVEMPVMDGLVTLRQLRARGHQMPVIMCSSLTQRGASVTLDALASGASDYVSKPAGQADRETALRVLAQELLPKIHALTAKSRTATALVSSAAPRRVVVPFPVAPASLPYKPQPIVSAPSVVVIGVSTGGPAALDVLLPALPAGFPLPILIVQHMPELFTGLLAERLNGRCRLPVCLAAEGDPVRPGSISIARGNWHMEVVAPVRAGSLPTLHLTQGPLENHCRPAVDVLFRTAAAVYGAGVLAVMLTGMGSDGLSGCRMIRAQGGGVLAQDQATCAVWGMPGSVVNAGLANKVLPLGAISSEILNIVAHGSRPAVELREKVR